MYIHKINKKDHISKVECIIRMIVHPFLWVACWFAITILLPELQVGCENIFIILLVFVGLLDGLLNTYFNIDFIDQQVMWLLFFVICFFPVYFFCN